MSDFAVFDLTLPPRGITQDAYNLRGRISEIEALGGDSISSTEVCLLLSYRYNTPINQNGGLLEFNDGSYRVKIKWP